jgi:hypothetical protein
MMSDEAHLHISEYVNIQNCRYWVLNNTRELHQRPLHSAEVSACCAVSSYGINGPCLFENAEDPY